MQKKTSKKSRNNFGNYQSNLKNVKYVDSAKVNTKGKVNGSLVKNKKCGF